jgi:hypothetical protein
LEELKMSCNNLGADSLVLCTSPDLLSETAIKKYITSVQCIPGWASASYKPVPEPNSKSCKIITTYFQTIHFNITLPSKPWSQMIYNYVKMTTAVRKTYFPTKSTSSLILAHHSALSWNIYI